jgi:hypothetical protein
MNRSLLYKCLVVLFVAMVMVSWVGAIMDDDDATNMPCCQAPVSFADQAISFLPELLGQRPLVFSPLINESSAGYLEMHEKSPPFAIPAF